MQALSPQKLSILRASLEGELKWDDLTLRLYATDASIYREIPLAVAYPKQEQDLKQLVQFAFSEGIALIPRTAGTSLAGQCVGKGIIVDMSRYMTAILDFDAQKAEVKVQPGVIRDELNRYLKPHNYCFGPNTSTANRAMIGGMLGNNSCGSYSITYGNTRDHIQSVKGFLSDGSEVVFAEITQEKLQEKLQLKTLEGAIYRQIYTELSKPEVQAEIRAEFPHPDIRRRNTGYALDEMLLMQPFTPNGQPFNLAKLICGSEGTLMLASEITLGLSPLLPKEQVMVVVHFDSLEKSLRAVTPTLAHKPLALELMDKIILDCTKENIEHSKNRFFLQGDPEAVLMVEFGAETRAEVEILAQKYQEDLENKGMGYAFSYLFPPDNHKANELRKAGLGLLSNIPGDAKAVAVIEDTAVLPDDLADYILEFDALMKQYGQKPVYYAHAGAGELHIRPVLNLRSEEGLKQLRAIATDSAKLVKKYKGSLSGEHGDGRVRGEFLPLMIGEKNYQLLRSLKQTWDAKNIFNPGKITDTPRMDEALRDEVKNLPEIKTVFDFSEERGFIQAIEKCNGSGDCRKLHTSGGTMCPSYMATQDEKDTTRARANALREFLTFSDQPDLTKRFDRKELYEVMDFCVSCKGCKSECPSNVDMATWKAEFLHQYYQSNPIPLRTRAIANIGKLNRLGAKIAPISNFMLRNNLTGGVMKSILGIAPQRELPAISSPTLKVWFERYRKQKPQPQGRKIYLFADEFTDTNDAEIGQKAVLLLEKLGYSVEIPLHADSGRSYLSKGLLLEAKALAEQNMQLLRDKITAETPMIGIEPSAILTFRDEFPRLVKAEDRTKAKEIGKNILLLDEFLAAEIEKGNIRSEQFSTASRAILLHGHCHQKALSSVSYTEKILSLPQNYTVKTIPSGCCGMAGSFGYEQEHYEVSMKMGELVLFPAVRKAGTETIIAALGTSCRHQIQDGTKRKAQHPVEILWEALAN